MARSGRVVRRLAVISQFHEQPAAIAAWERAAAPLLSWLTPARRRAILLAGAVVTLRRPADWLEDSLYPDWSHRPRMAATLALLLAFLWLCYQAAIRYRELPAPIRRHPQFALHATFWAMLVVLWAGPGGPSTWRSLLTGLVIVLPFFLWRCGYMLLSAQRGRIAGSRFRDHLIYLLPAWGGSDTPYGKGLDYLSRCEARTESELARSQLAGAKLFALSVLWNGLAWLMDRLLYAPQPGHGPAALPTLGIPRLADLLADGGHAPLSVCWASMYLELVNQVLRIAARGHVIIGTLRLFGFNVFRNTYKPLLAESVQAFWNRYFYYFKELMSELFFMPVFARHFRAWPRVRLFAAVMAAAGLGNMYYHVIRRDDLLSGDFVGLWHGFNSRVFYCLLLALGIFVSMLREQARGGVAPSAAPHRRMLRIAGVWTFFALIYVWDVHSRAGFGERAEFVAGLFGLGRS